MMRIDAGVNPRAAGPALAPDGAAGQYGAAATPATNGARNEAGNEAGAIRITPSRRIVERRDPAISFKVTAAGFSAFDILLTTDPALFEARNADRRTAANFRSSRQDFDGESIPAEIGFYMTPTAFLGALAAARPRPERLYYVAVGYRGDERTSGVFSTPAETLADLAPYVQLAANLGGASLSAVLGAAVERLGQVGAGRRITGARPLSQVGMPRQSIGGLPVHGSRDGARQINGGAPPERPAEAGPARQTPDPAPEEAPPGATPRCPGKVRPRHRHRRFARPWATVLPLRPRRDRTTIRPPPTARPPMAAISTRTPPMAPPPAPGRAGVTAIWTRRRRPPARPGRRPTTTMTASGRP
ncbi:MAG: hypothetical protein IID49_12515, partial [Proteobacteria bacterium]|nr:hypothetical protein [Pseudomonadota bacterium]